MPDLAAGGPDPRRVGLQQPIEELAGSAPLGELEGGADPSRRRERADHACHALLLIVEQRRCGEMAGLPGLEGEQALRLILERGAPSVETVRGGDRFPFGARASSPRRAWMSASRIRVA